MASTTWTESKTALRREIREKLKELRPEERRESDEALFRALFRLEAFRQAESLFLFCGVGTEPETLSRFDSLLVQGKLICLPRCLSGGEMELRRYKGRQWLKENRWGIPEPDERCPVIRPEQVEFALVPALCYDREGYRLGHGGGYYDRFLARYSGPSAGFCRERVLMEHLPREAHDRQVDVVLTENRAIPTARS